MSCIWEDFTERVSFEHVLKISDRFVTPFVHIKIFFAQEDQIVTNSFHLPMKSGKEM